MGKPPENINASSDFKEQFQAFSYFPGVVLIFNRENEVVFQNKPIGTKIVEGEKLEIILDLIKKPSLLQEINQVRETGKIFKSHFSNPFNKNTLSITVDNYVLATNQYLLFFIDEIEIPFKEKELGDKSSFCDNQREDLINQYRLIANSLADIFFILDMDHKFTFISPSVERILQFHYNELIGVGFDVLVPKWSSNTLKKNIDTVHAILPDSRESQKFTLQLSAKYGRLNWYEVQVTGIYDENNKLKGFNGICRDITERLKYEEALRLAKRKAEESDNLKSAFLANMSHEIRTPLNGIIGFSTMLNNKELPEEKKEQYADYIISSSNQLLTLISDIIDISKIEAGQLSMFKMEIDVVKVLNELLETISFEKDRLNKGQIELQLINPVKELKIITDEIRLKQVLINLLSNALKFTDEGKVIFGFELIDNKTVRFYVRDTGSGIPRNLQKAVFERFRQGNIDRHAKTAGTGIGLAISKGLIQLMGGTIGLKSQEHVGSEFYFKLPIK
jgi:PAS domain S-box-containing protein